MHISSLVVLVENEGGFIQTRASIEYAEVLID
jgi:hypothetical protein